MYFNDTKKVYQRVTIMYMLRKQVNQFTCEFILRSSRRDTFSLNRVSVNHFIFFLYFRCRDQRSAWSLQRVRHNEIGL